ncbi:MAG: DUF1598 domain-containing protein [Planctomycetaceae bacterium]
MIDAQGVVTPVFSKSRSKALRQKRMAALAAKSLSRDMNKPSQLRMISLVQLEKACEEYARKKKHVPVEIQFLAGLQRIDYVFVDPERRDIIIAGPAEGFAPDETGRVVGLTTGRPPLRADDLVVALRALQQSSTIGCSIDPVKERLANMIRYNNRNSFPASPNVAGSRFATLARILGRQNVRVWGVPAHTHFGQTLVEADYVMKLVCIGLKRVRVKGFRSYLSMIGAKGNTMQRWWFLPLYDAFHTTEDENAFQFAGQRAQLMSQEEKVSATGNRTDSKTTRKSTTKFAKLFTEKFPELTTQVPVFAELQNLMDLAILAALLKKKRLPEKVGWKMSLFLDPERATVIKGYAPKQVPTVYNYKRLNRRMFVGLINGGVTIDPLRTINQIEFRKVTRGPLFAARRKIKRDTKSKAPNRWWWDAATRD